MTASVSILSYLEHVEIRRTRISALKPYISIIFRGLDQLPYTTLILLHILGARTSFESISREQVKDALEHSVNIILIAPLYETPRTRNTLQAAAIQDKLNTYINASHV